MWGRRYQLRHEKLHPEFGVSIRGIGLGNALTPGLVREINAATDRYSFVCLPNQSIDDDRQLALTRPQGQRPSITRNRRGPARRRPETARRRV